MCLVSFGVYKCSSSSNKNVHISIIVMQAEAGQLEILKEILEEYISFTSHKVYYHKSSLVPINLNE
jgi:hypothetical protein